MFETKKRTVLRMVTYRVTAWLFTILWTYMFTGNVAQSTGFATVLHILLSIDYYIHERIWLRIRWGLVGIDDKYKHENSLSNSQSSTPNH